MFFTLNSIPDGMWRTTYGQAHVHAMCTHDPSSSNPFLNSASADALLKHPDQTILHNLTHSLFIDSMTPEHPGGRRTLHNEI